MKNLYALFCFAIFATGCGYKFISHTEIIQKYRGDNIENLIGMWGAPQSTTPLPSGNTVYLFTSEIQTQEKTSEVRAEHYGTNPDGRSVAVYSTVTKTCKTTVTADKKGQVLNLNSQGEGCAGAWVKGGD